MSSTVRSDAALVVSDLPVPLEIREIRTARRLRLRLDGRRHLLKLTGPVGMNRRRALAWVTEQRDWIDRQLADLSPAIPLEPGTVIPLMGEEVRLRWDPAAPRAPALAGGELVCGGAAEGFALRIARFLRGRAQEVLAAETRALALSAGLIVAQVSVGDADTRWGSCSASGRIRYSWRLILAPPEARRFVVAHEVAHLRHLDHGARFKALERALFGGDPAAARALLRSVGERLKRVGRGP